MERVGTVLVETYRIGRLIGEGGMSSVHEATHVRLPKRFAVKFLKVPMLENTEALQRFRREAEIVAALDHPHIVSLFDYNITDDGVPYIVLEFLDGEHLGERLKRGKLDLGATLRIVVPVASALAYAHARDIVHRDLKPENVIITHGELVKVVDFGIARMGGRAALTAVNTVLGTAPYMAPEQLIGSKLDGRADQFAFAAMVYEMLSGEMAFGADSVQVTAARVAFHHPPPIAGLGDAVNRALTRALAKEPDGRFSTVEGFAQAMVEAASSPAPRPSAPRRDLAPRLGETTAVDLALPSGRGRTLSDMPFRPGPPVASDTIPEIDRTATTPDAVATATATIDRWVTTPDLVRPSIVAAVAAEEHQKTAPGLAPFDPALAAPPGPLRRTTEWVDVPLPDRKTLPPRSERSDVLPERNVVIETTPPKPRPALPTATEVVAERKVVIETTPPTPRPALPAAPKATAIVVSPTRREVPSPPATRWGIVLLAAAAVLGVAGAIAYLLHGA